MSSMTRYPLILAAVAGALALGGCGSANNGNGGAASAGSGKDAAFEGALKFSQCMRQHGVDMPDPKRDSNGGISLIGPPGGKRTKLGDPKLKAAQSACQKYMNIGGGPPMDPAQQARLQDAFVAYAGCMRGKGIDMPDPKVGSHGVQMTVTKGQPGDGGKGNSTGPAPDSPLFKAADKTCHHFLAGVEPKGKGGGQGPMFSTVKP
jgi:hypothetical protein